MPAEQRNVRGNEIRPSEVLPTDVLDLPSYSGSSSAPDGTFFFDEGESTMKYKNQNGTVYEAGVGDTIGSPSDRISALYGDSVDANSVSTPTITDSKTDTDYDVGDDLAGGYTTYVRAAGDSASGVSSGTYVNLLTGGGLKDDNSEFSSGQFTPEKDGEYLFVYQVDMGGGNTVKGDELEAQIADITNGGKVTERHRWRASGGFPGRYFAIREDLTGGDTYELQVRNRDSSYDLDGGLGTISRSDE